MIISLTGNNEYLIKNELNLIKNDFNKEYGDNTYEQIDASETEYQEIYEKISNLSFLSPNKLLILRNGSANKKFTENFEKIPSILPDTTKLILVENILDKRLAYYKNLKKFTDFIVFDDLDNYSLTKWVINSANDIGGSIDSASAKYLIDIAGQNQMKLFNEINKLINYDKKITKNNIDLLVDPIPQTTIFQLLDVAFSGKQEELIKIYNDQKRQNVEPQKVIALLTWQINIIALIKVSKLSNAFDIASKTKLSPYIIGKSLPISNKLSLADIKKLTTNLLELDIKLKTKTVDVDDALMQFLISIKS